MSKKASTKAVAYLRTSSASNVADSKNPDRDSDKRQRAAIHAYAKRAGFVIVDEFYDQAVSGADPVNARAGFVAMMERILGNGVRTIMVESAGRFARDLIVQETAYEALKAQGIDLIAADSPDAFKDDTPTAKFIRQVLGAVSELDKAMIVAKLKAARDRKRATGVKVDGRKSWGEKTPAAVALARKLHRYPTNGRRQSLRQVSAELAAAGYVNSKGQPFAANQIKRMIEW
jgi:DNA invertase Pin-like site-specific DNA recombinase